MMMLTDGSKAVAYITRWQGLDRQAAARELVQVIYEECVNQVRDMETKLVEIAKQGQQ